MMQKQYKIIKDIFCKICFILLQPELSLAPKFSRERKLWTLAEKYKGINFGKKWSELPGKWKQSCVSHQNCLMSEVMIEQTVYLQSILSGTFQVLALVFVFGSMLV